MAIYGHQVGTLFLGTLRPSTRAFLQQFFARARKQGYTRFVEPAAGALAMSQLAVKAGFDAHRIEASDVTLFSALMGYGIMGQRVDCLEIYADGYEEYDLGDPAVALWALACCMAEEHAANPIQDAALRQFKRESDRHIAGLRKQLEKARDLLGGMSYKPADLFDQLDDCWDDPHCLVCVNPPTYTGGFERFYETGGRIRWAEPRYRLFDAETGLRDLMRRAFQAKCLLLCYQERATGDAIGVPVYIQDHLRRARDQSTYLHVYIVPNRLDESLEIAGGLTLGRMSLTGVDPGDRPPLSSDYEVTCDSELVVKKISAQVATYYRALWTHKFSIGSPAILNLGMFVDGYIAGVFGYNTGMAVGFRSHGAGKHRDVLQIHYGVVGPHKTHRLSRLLTMVCLTRDAAHLGIASDLLTARIRRIHTTQQTRYPESKEMRGLMKLIDRKPDVKHGFKLTYGALIDERPLHTVFSRWLEREANWRKARARAKGKGA